MPNKRWPSRSELSAFGGKRPKPGVLLLLIMALLLAALLVGAIYLRSLVTDLAVSDAQDMAVAAVNDVVKKTLTEGNYSYADLVRLEKDESGAVTAVTTDIAAINALAADISSGVAGQTEKSIIEVKVPLGNLTGSSILMDKGPEIPVSVITLASSFAGFRSDLSGAGINQTRHQIILELQINLSLLLPWRTVNTTVDSEVLVAETIIVGEVPQSYLNLEN